MFIRTGRVRANLSVSIKPWTDDYGTRAIVSYARLVPPNAFARWLSKR